MHGNKILTPVINNNLKLIDSYEFFAHALAKFPAILTSQKRKKDSSHTYSTELNFGTMLDEFLTTVIMILMLFIQANKMNFLSGTMNKSRTQFYLISRRRWFHTITVMYSFYISK